MVSFIEANVKFQRIAENGKVKKVNEPYLVNAMSCTEAESKVIERVTPMISGDFTVSAVKESNVSEVFRYDGADYWFKAKVNFFTTDEKTGVEKATPVYYLVQAIDFKNAYENFLNSMKGTIADFEIVGLTLTKFIDVID